jgi:hypothetical protein
MSHRIVMESPITNKDLAIQALKSAGWKYTEQGSNVLVVTSGPMRNATINLLTGNVTGDSDLHSKDTLDALRQSYSEAIVRQEAIKSGATIETREVLKNGNIRFVLTANFS